MTLAWKQAVIAFVVGGCLGAAGTWWSLPRVLHHRWRDGRGDEQMLERFSSKLHLTPEQRAQAASILEAKRQRLDSLREQARPQFDQIRVATSAEIRRLLTPEQQRQFDVMETEWQARMQRFRDRKTAPPPPPSDAP